MNHTKFLGICAECETEITTEDVYCSLDGNLYHLHCYRSIWKEPYKHPPDIIYDE